MVASSELLVRRLRLRCSGRHPHSVLAGSLNGVPKCKQSQIWPIKLCQYIIEGIVDVKNSRKANAQRGTHAHNAYPASSSSSSLPAPACPGCQSHCARDDDRHTRVAGVCRYPFDVAAVWTCKACKKHQHVHHPDHTKDPVGCRYGSAQTRRHGHKASADPYVKAHEVEEAAEDVDEGVNTPPPETPLGSWTPVNDLLLVSDLEAIRDRDGWVVLGGETTLVTHNARDVKTPEPRFPQHTLPRRSVFGFFPDNNHEHGSWYQLQNNVLSDTRGNIGYSVPILVQVYHKAEVGDHDGSASDKNKPDDVDAPPGLPNPPFKPADAGAPTTPIQRKSQPADAVEHGDMVLLPEPLDSPEAEGKELVPVDWSSWDLGRALRSLRTNNNAVITRAIRQLHLRWFHASSIKMISLLRAAGLPANVLDLVKPVCDTCKVCRLWTRPADRPQTSSRLSTEFNVLVEVDLLFIESLVVLHMCDCCIRWSAGKIIASKQVSDILDGLVDAWFKIFGPPRTLVSDHEFALF